VRNDLSRLNTRAPFIELSSKRGDGMDRWLAWLGEQRQARWGKLE
jgi:Ni2+-binding GTPase involved in maturation of urease and hydrogenase